ncbi:MAG: hypothetical protein LKJ88_05940 [Bacilli bacterium]|jgi:sugar phosphate isomerase/epimerase|nr:hypothetical protein [Bacilli bacterium]
MRRVFKSLLLTALGSLIMTGCGQSSNSEAVSSLSEETKINTKFVFSSSDLVQSSFGGLGVEWGVYEDTDKLSDFSKKRIYENIKRLNPVRIRCMINYDWFVEDFDDKGDQDKTNDTWSYNFANKWGDNLTELLTYCQEHNIQVAFGSWNVVGTLENDVWNMMEEATADVRWAKMSAHVMDYLVNTKGFNCIRWFINGNEPNYLGVKGSSKNWNNSLAKWEQGVKNVRAALDEKGLSQIGIVGGDTTGFDGTDEYFSGIAKDCKDKVADYGAHLYLSNYYIDGGQVLDNINTLNAKIKAIDEGYGTSRPLDIWESGLLDGKNAETDGNSLIKTVSYGIRMADFTIQAALGGVNGICYWDFDDGMNFMYSSGTPIPKRWGMFSSLASDQAFDQGLRPWYHSSLMLTNLLRPGSKIYGSVYNDRKIDKDFRALGVIQKDNKNGGIVAVNRGAEDVEKTFRLDDKVDSDGKLYIYLFGEGTIRLGEDGFILPNYTIDGSLNKNLTVKIPANTLLVVSSEAF